MIPALLTIRGDTVWVKPERAADGDLRILNVEILCTFGIVSLGVYGIVLAGYAPRTFQSIPFLGWDRSSRADDFV